MDRHERDIRRNDVKNDGRTEENNRHAGHHLQESKFKLSGLSFGKVRYFIRARRIYMGYMRRRIPWRSLEQHERLTNTCERRHTRSLFARIQQRLALARTYSTERFPSLFISAKRTDMQTHLVEHANHEDSTVRSRRSLFRPVAIRADQPPKQTLRHRIAHGYTRACMRMCVCGASSYIARENEEV